MVISKSVLVPVNVISLVNDVSDAKAPPSVYELSVGTVILLLPTSAMLGAVLSIIILEPDRLVCVNVRLVVLSSLYNVMVNARPFVSASDESTA